jgi:uncharacterized protein YjbI with pentapeptide repeats
MAKEWTGKKPTSDNLKQILADHKSWLDVERKSQPPHSLVGANLQRADLKRANLQRCDFREADLRGADLESADLRGAVFRKAKLRGVRLNWSKLSEADLRGVKFKEAKLKQADLQQAKLAQADLQRINLRGAKLQGATLQSANLRDANFGGAILRRAELKGAKLHKVNFQNADLRGAKIQKSYLMRAKLQGAKLQSADLQRADLTKAILINARLVEANLLETNFTGANLSGADLTGAHIRRCNFTDVICTHITTPEGEKHTFKNPYAFAEYIKQRERITELFLNIPLHELSALLGSAVADAASSLHPDNQIRFTGVIEVPGGTSYQFTTQNTNELARIKQDLAQLKKAINQNSKLLTEANEKVTDLHAYGSQDFKWQITTPFGVLDINAAYKNLGGRKALVEGLRFLMSPPNPNAPQTSPALPASNRTPLPPPDKKP